MFLGKRVTMDTEKKEHGFSEGPHSFKDLVDIERLRDTFERFSQATGFTTGLASYPEQELLIGTGWRDICTKFHRACPISEVHCKQSNLDLTSKLEALEKLNIRPCENGLVDGATPIIVDGVHLASLFTGQVLFEKPDIEQFKKQAKDYGYDVEAYLEALEEVPVVNENKFRKVMGFLSNMAVTLAEAGLREMRLHQMKNMRKRAEQALKESERKYRLLANNVTDVIWSLDMDLKFTYISPSVAKLRGYTPEEAMQISLYQTFTPASYQKAIQTFSGEIGWDGESGISSDRSVVLELDTVRKDGGVTPVEISASFIRDETGAPTGIIGITRDITSRKRAEKLLQESEARYRGVAEDTPGLICSFLPGGEITFVNKSYCAYYKKTAEELVGSNFQKLIPKAERKTVMSNISALTSKTPTQTHEHPVIGPNGDIRWQRWTNRAVFDDQGRVIFYQSIGVDITERKKAETALSESEARLSHIIMGSPVPTFVVDNNHVTTHWNTALEKVSGISGSQVVGTKNQWMAFYSMERPVMADLIVDKVPEDEISRYYGGKYSKSDSITGAYEAEDFFPDMGEGGKWLFFTAAPLLSSSGETIGAVETLQDTTARKKAEGALIEREEKYRSLANNLNVGIYRNTAGTKGKFIEANPAIAEMFGFGNREEFLKVNVSDLYKKTHERTVFNEKLIKKGSIRNEELELKKKDGTIFIGSVSAVAVKDEKGDIKYFDGIIEDVTRRKQMEEERRMSMRRFQALLQLNQMTEATISEITDFALEEAVKLTESKIGYLAFLNKDESVLTMHSWSKSAMKECAIADKPIHYPVVNTGLWGEAVRQRKPIITNDYSAANPLKKGIPNGHVVLKRHMNAPIFDSGKIVAVAGVGNKEAEYNESDVQQVSLLIQGMWRLIERKRAETERGQLQAQLTQAQKMESVGRLAGGVAHDFNNMLSVILGNTEMAMLQTDPALPLHANLKEIQKASQRSADITRQLLAFARKQTIAPKVLDLNDTVESMLKMLRRLIGEDIDLTWLPGKNLGLVRMDPSQIDQILANLCINARDAIGGVGKITIETGRATFDEVYCEDHPGFVPGDFVLMAVSDDGCGMDRETLENVFEPFFTTKDVDKGTGLGLATVYGIVKQNNGFINAYSESKQGTTFKVYLPRHDDATEQFREKGPVALDSKGSETILLVEDDSSILKITTKILEHLGYAVLPAAAPMEAIELAREYSNDIHLLITDVVMPEMNGWDLAENLLTIYPHLRSLFISGYTANVIAHHGILDEGVNFIQKPFSKQDLSVKVREALDESKG